MKNKNCGCGHMRSGGTVCHKCGGKVMSFGGAVKSAKKYAFGGTVDDTDPPYDAPDTKVISGDGSMKKKKLSYSQKQYYKTLKNKNLTPAEANDLLRESGYPTVYDIKNETTPMEQNMKMSEYSVDQNPNFYNNKPSYYIDSRQMSNTPVNVLPGYKMFLGALHNPKPTFFERVFGEGLDQNNYINAIENLNELKQNKLGKFSFGGAISGIKKKYRDGGQVKDETKMTKDKEMYAGPSAVQVSDPGFDINQMLDKKPIEVSEKPTATVSTGYKEEITKEQAKGDDRSLPNWGRAKKEQMKLNELIRKDIAEGKKVELLEEDDVIGEKTLAAMNMYEGKGYTRPELFKDKWLAEYKKNSAAGIGIKGYQKNDNYDDQIKNKGLDFSQTGWFGLPKQLLNDNKAEYNKSNQGWPSDYLKQKGGIEINTKQLKQKDLDTYEKIFGVPQLQSEKGLRITSPGTSKAYIDAAEKNQYYEKNGKKINTSIEYGKSLIDNHDKVMIIPTGKKTYDRDLVEIYWQDKTNPDKWHAGDSLIAINGEGIFGEVFNDSRQDERQKSITEKSEGAFEKKYGVTPSSWRKLYTDSNTDDISYKKPESKTSSLNKSGSKTNLEFVNPDLLKKYSIPSVPVSKTESKKEKKQTGKRYAISDANGYSGILQRDIKTATSLIKQEIANSENKQKELEREKNKSSYMKEVDDINDKQELIRRAMVRYSHKSDNKTSPLKEGYLDMVGSDVEKYDRKKYIYDDVNKKLQEILSKDAYRNIPLEEKFAMLQRHYNEQLKNLKK